MEPLVLFVLICSSYVLILIWLFALIKNVVNQWPGFGSFRRVVDAKVWAAYFGKSSSGGSAPRKDDALERRAEQMVDECRLNRFRLFCRLVQHFVAVSCVYHTSLMPDPFNAKERPSFLEDGGSTKYGATLVIFLMAMTICRFPKLLTKRALDGLHVFVMVCLAAVVARSKDGVVLVLHMPTFVVTRLALAALIGNSSLCIVMNTLFGVVSSATYPILSSADDTLHTAGWQASHHFITEGFATAVIVAVAWVVEHRSFAEVRATITAKRSSQAETIVHSLLAALCDAVLQGADDDALTIMNDARLLAALLFRQPANGSLRGSSLLELLHEEDRPQLMEQLTKLEPSGDARSLSVRLIDVSGGEVSVHLYYVCFLDLNDQRQYVIGVCENAGREAGGVAPLESQRPPTAEAKDLGPKKVEAMNCTSSDNDSSGESECSASSGLLPEAESLPPAVWFDVFSEGFAMTRCSASFTALCGLNNQGQNLLEWIGDRDAFKGAVQAAVNDAVSLNLSDSGHCRHEVGPITLLPPSVKRAGLQLAGTGAIVVEDLDLDTLQCEPSSEFMIVRFELSDVVMKKQRGKKRRRQSDGGSRGVPSVSFDPPRDEALLLCL